MKLGLITSRKTTRVFLIIFAGSCFRTTQRRRGERENEIHSLLNHGSAVQCLCRKSSDARREEERERETYIFIPKGMSISRGWDCLFITTFCIPSPGGEKTPHELLIRRANPAFALFSVLSFQRTFFCFFHEYYIATSVPEISRKKYFL